MDHTHPSVNVDISSPAGKVLVIQVGTLVEDQHHVIYYLQSTMSLLLMIDSNCSE
jgi:hypothetical protein